MLRRTVPVLLARCSLGAPGVLVRPVLRAEQGPVHQLRFQGHPDRAFRRLLLRPRADGRAGRRPDGGALVRPALQGAEPRVPRAEADHPLRLALRLPADQRDRGERRRHRRRDRLRAEPGGHAVHRRVQRFRARAARTRWRTSSSTTSGRAGAPAPASAPSSPSRRRSGSPRAWRSTSRSARSTPRRRCGCATRRSRASCRPSSR